MGLEKIVDVNFAVIGDEVDFTVTARNNGSITGSNIAVSEILSDGFEYVSHTTTIGTYDESLGLWDIDVLNAGEEAALNIKAIVVEGIDYRNTAVLVEVDQEDINPANDEASVEVTIEEPICPIVVYNAVTPNGDGANDYFYIECIENYPENRLQIYNRWGVKVFDQRQYNNDWNGQSNGRNTINQKENLPVGNYFYHLVLGNGEEAITGYLYLQ